MEAGKLKVSRELEERIGALDIGADTEAGVGDRNVDVRFGCKMDGARRLVLFKNTFHASEVADVHLFKGIIPTIIDDYIARICRISETIHIDEKFARIFFDRVIQIITSNEARASRHDDSFFKL